MAQDRTYVEIGSILTAEVDISAPLNVLDTNWCDFNNKEGEDPVRRRGKSSRSATDG